jgi:hypothetical protein
MGIRRQGDDGISRTIDSTETAFKLTQTTDGRLVAFTGADERTAPSDTQSVDAAHTSATAGSTESDQGTDELVRANRQRIEELRQRRYGVALRDDLGGGWLLAAVCVVILALVARAFTRALPLEAPLLLGASIILVLLVAIGFGVRKRLMLHRRTRS